MYFHSLQLTPAASTSGCAIRYILGHQSPAPPLSIYLDRYWHIQGDKNGRLYLWDIRKVNTTTPLSPSGTHSQISTLPESSACIADSWEHPAMPCGLTDKLVCTFYACIYFSVELYLCVCCCTVLYNTAVHKRAYVYMCVYEFECVFDQHLIVYTQGQDGDGVLSIFVIKDRNCQWSHLSLFDYLAIDLCVFLRLHNYL